MKQMLSTIIIMILFSISMSNQVIAHGGGGQHHEVEVIVEYGTMRAPDHCNQTTAELLVKSKDASALAFDKDRYQIEKNVCYKLTFQNLAPFEHDFTIDSVEGVNGIKPIVLHIMNNTSGKNNDGSASMSILTPNTDTEFYTRCTILGHEAAGMFATLVIGKGNPDEKTGFLSSLTIPLVLISLLGIGKITRSKKFIENL